MEQTKQLEDGFFNLVDLALGRIGYYFSSEEDKRMQKAKNVITEITISEYIDKKLESFTSQQHYNSVMNEIFHFLKEDFNKLLNKNQDVCFEMYERVKEQRDHIYNKSLVGVLGRPIYNPVIKELDEFIQWFEN